MSRDLKEGALPPSALRTFSRRSLLDWLGKASVLALGGEVLAACSSSGMHLDSGLDAGDGGFDGGADADLANDADTETGDPWGFSPPTSEPGIYDGWPVRTVDRQELESILASWRLRIDGLVESPVELDFAELIELERLNALVDFHCVEGWSVQDVPWNGVHLSTLFDLVGPTEEATHVTFHTIDGRYNESLPIDIALEPRTLLAYGIAEHTLPLRHGFPTRLVVPRLWAYKSAKYIDRIELTNEPLEGYWVALGYPYLGEVPEGRLRPDRY